MHKAIEHISVLLKTEKNYFIYSTYMSDTMEKNLSVLISMIVAFKKYIAKEKTCVFWGIFLLVR